MEQGLPTNEVFHIIEGGDGYIWIATNTGLCRYNGSGFQIYNSQDGLPTSAIYHLFPQEDSSIVGVCSNAEFFKIKADSISLLIHPDTSRKYLKPGLSPFSFQVDSLGHYHIGTRHGYFIFNQNSSLIKVDVTRKGEAVKTVFSYLDNNRLFVYHSVPLRSLDRFSRFQIWNSKEKIVETDYNFGATHRSTYATEIGSHLIITAFDHVFDIDKETNRVQRIDLGYDCIGSYSFDNLLFVCTDKHGVYCFEEVNNELRQKEHLLAGFSVSSVAKSSEGKYWFSTLEDGIRSININGPELVFKASSNENITSFGDNDSSIFLGFESGKIYSKKTGLVSVSIDKIYHISSGLDKPYLSGAGLWSIEFDGTVIDILENFDNYEKVASKKILEINDSIRLGITRRTIFRWNTRTDFIELIDTIAPHLFYSNLFLINSLCYTTSISDKVQMIDPFDSNNTIDFPIKSPAILIFDYLDNIYAVTVDSRVCILHDNEFKTIIGSNEKVMGSAVSASYRDKVLVMSTSKGLYSWELPREPNGFPKLVDFEPIPLVIQVSLFDQYVYFSTPRRLYKKPIDNFVIQRPSIKKIVLQIDDKLFINESQVSLDYDQNDLEIHLDNVSFSKPFLHYRYRLVGMDKQFYTTSATSVHYDNLSPGSYTFEISATSDGYNYSDTKIIQINIGFPFWMKWWFWTLVLLSSLALIYFIINTRIKRIKSQAKLKETVAQLKAQALSAQLNPHLVFNVMNSIQGMVSEGEIEEANIYISRFSRYLRNSLKMSKVSSISLMEEIELIEQYLELEKLRFRDQLNYQIEIHCEELNWKVPALIVQPIVENGIKHGLRPSKERVGHLKIVLSENQDFLIISIEDNGVGFKGDFAFRDGLRITEERLKVISQDNSLAIKQMSHPTIVQLKLKKWK